MASKHAFRASPTSRTPLAVARILADMNMDTVCLQTALLHDVVEDTGITNEEIRKTFGEQVAQSVDGVTKLGKLDFYTRRGPPGPRAFARCSWR